MGSSPIQLAFLIEEISYRLQRIANGSSNLHVELVGRSKQIKVPKLAQAE